MATSGSDLDDVPLAARRGSLKEDLPLQTTAHQKKIKRVQRQLDQGSSGLVIDGALPSESSEGIRLSTETPPGARKTPKSDEPQPSSSRRRGLQQGKAQIPLESKNAVVSVRSSTRRRNAKLVSESSPLLELPWEIQSKILREACSDNAAMVPRLATVCSLWRQVGFQSSQLSIFSRCIGPRRTPRKQKPFWFFREVLWKARTINNWAMIQNPSVGPALIPSHAPLELTNSIPDVHRSTLMACGDGGVIPAQPLNN